LISQRTARKAVLSFCPKPVNFHFLSPEEIQNLIEDATFDYTMGDHEAALKKLDRATNAAPSAFEAWHAVAEINFSLRRFDAALLAAEQAHRLRPDDLFINTTLSRIWMEKGDKATAEKYGAQAKILSWKDQLKNPETKQSGL
jgi:cytochrome c-type biogenesis protein CcmH/NrfG